MTTETPTKPASRLKTRFAEELPAKLAEEFGLKNTMSLPQLEKIVLHVNMGRHLDGTKIPANIKDTILRTLTTVSGQKPIVIKAKRSVANFKVREGYDTSVKVTLRRDRMWDFLDRFINLCTPRIKDFRGLPIKSFDKAGNYSMGITEQAVFPEIDMSRENFIHGMHINFVFKNSDAQRSRFVLEQLGMPFQRPEDN